MPPRNNRSSRWTQPREKAEFPPVSQVLVDALRRIWPVELPGLLEPDREIWARVGREEVIAFLQAQTEKQSGGPTHTAVNITEV